MWRLFLFLSIFLVSCSEEETDTPTDSTTDDPVIDVDSKLYVCDQGSDRVVILNPDSDELEELSTISINLDDDEDQNDAPHFVVIDELNGYWFVTTFQSGYVGMYDLDTDALIDSIFLGDSPALLAVDEGNKRLYVSRMMDMGMMDGAEESKLNVLDYSPAGLERKDDICLATSGGVLEFPQPHAISFSNNTDRGALLISASFTHDWFSRTDLGSIPMTMLTSFEEDEVAPVQSNELFPLSVVQKDNYAFFSLSGSVDAEVKGQVQSWVVGETSDPSLKSVYEFGISSKLWHVIESPVSSHIFVVLSGDADFPDSEAGVACLSYDNAEEFIDCNENQTICDGDADWSEDLGNGVWDIGEEWTDAGDNGVYDTTGALKLEWQTPDSSFDTLHGITASADGAFLYVSSRGNGSVYLLDANDGTILYTASGVGMEMGMEMGSLSGIAVTHSE